ncbi:MAG: glycosyltransferase family 2 protein [Aquamicrobium sp.]|nr:glycosyltransferase family 2 protein [Mesorhizobium sp. Pch-S]MBR2692328.1 glycosyltransferase family 2 protein [Aquamicrobium sp.]
MTQKIVRKGGFKSHHDHGQLEPDLLKLKDDLTFAVVVPCYNEAGKIAATLETIPPYIDTVYVVDDQSKDDTLSVIEQVARNDSRVNIIRHEVNRGVGAAISTGYIQCAKDGIDIAVVMAGDGQMDPDDLPALLIPVIKDQADYVKGNRFFHHTGTAEMPRHRLFGNLALSVMTKIVSGYWHVSDTQCGYTAINREALEAVDWTAVYPRYGCPNDILTRLNVADMRVAEVPVKARYGENWSSGMKVGRILGPMLRLLSRLFFYRMYYKYVFLNGHPIIIYYAAAAAFGAFGGGLFIYMLIKLLATSVIPKAALIMFGFSFVVMIQLLLAAFSLDYQANQSISVIVRDPRGRR